jgi:membrane protein required for beta-lactamase induction
MHRFKDAILWSLMTIVVVLFWFSFRSPVHQMEYTLAALVFWGITYLVNRKLKNEKNQEEE